ncbi:hypothetical protein [Alicyclobacillus macrosporangiidus]|uniref:hypothetical protein n=1 Tax=Alicyclobacillus macrosporangiidus TaxID=392015 RepID=UPI000495A7A1|nr:hypothetical protein [Alicyclobacillus macrosporangiidus]
MAIEQTKEAEHVFMVSTEIFQHPGLDIYTQMVCIVLQSYKNESALPTLGDIARLGRMTTKQATGALQALVDLRILPHKIFRQIIGEFEDDRLSWTAKGLLAYCKTHPHVRLQDLVELSSKSGEDEHHIRNAIKELDRYGYLDDLPELKRVIH